MLVLPKEIFDLQRKIFVEHPKLYPLLPRLALINQARLNDLLPFISEVSSPLLFSEDIDSLYYHIFVALKILSEHLGFNTVLTFCSETLEIFSSCSQSFERYYQDLSLPYDEETHLFAYLFFLNQEKIQANWVMLALILLTDQMHFLNSFLPEEKNYPLGLAAPGIPIEMKICTECQKFSRRLSLYRELLSDLSLEKADLQLELAKFREENESMADRIDYYVHFIQERHGLMTKSI